LGFTFYLAEAFSTWAVHFTLQKHFLSGLDHLIGHVDVFFQGNTFYVAGRHFLPELLAFSTWAEHFTWQVEKLSDWAVYLTS
jgi:hypothetical protein